MFGNHLTADTLMNVAQDLDDSTLPYMADVCVFDHLENPSLREHIERAGVVFYDLSQTQDEQ